MKPQTFIKNMLPVVGGLLLYDLAIKPMIARTQLG